MPTTPRMTIPYPSDNQDPWYDAFVGMVQALDSSCYAAREDRQIVIMGGGTFSFNVDLTSTTGAASLSWTGSIYIASPITGFTWTVAPGSASLVDGQLLYVSLTRAPTSNVTVAAVVANQVPSSDEALLLGIRRGTGADAHFYFRNGKVLANGDVANVLDTNGGGGGGGGSVRDFKESCRVATTGDVVVTGAAPAIVDGVSVQIDDRILVYLNANPAQNGIYRVTVVGSGLTGTWVRAEDFNESADVSAGSLVPVTEGDTHKDILFELATNDPIVLDTTPLTFVAIGANFSTNIPRSLNLTASVGLSGSSERASREDHLHQIEVAQALDLADVTASAASAGASSLVPRADHKHNISTDSAVSNPPGTTSAAGVSAALARADHTHGLAAFGSTVGTFCDGADSRIPTQGENDALVGTSGTPASGNKYVTNADARNTNDRTASGVRTATTVVSVSAATAPSANQALVATNSTTATWQQVDHVNLANKGTNTHSTIDTHLASTSNPHSTTASQVGAPPTTRSISAGTGLTGGGDLSADRTLTVSYGTSGTTACVGNDSRLSDSRTPTSHASTHNAGGGDALAIDAVAGTGSLRTLGTAATSACAGNDSRLTNARTPTTHASTHQNGGADEVATATAAANAIPKAGSGGKLDVGWVPLGSSSTTVCVGNDSRLSDTRTPTAHAASHVGGGSDAVAVATTSVAGLMSSTDKTKLDGVSSTPAQMILLFGSTTAPANNTSATMLPGYGAIGPGTDTLYWVTPPSPANFYIKSISVWCGTAPAGAGLTVGVVRSGGGGILASATVASGAQTATWTGSVAYGSGGYFYVLIKSENGTTTPATKITCCLCLSTS